MKLILIFLLGTFTAFAQKDAKDLYLDKCAVCHGPDGAGKTAMGRKLKVKSVQETAAKVKGDEMMKIVEMGKAPEMAPFGKDFNKDQIKALVEYYRGLAK